MLDKPGGMKFKVAAKPQRRSVAPSDVSKPFSSPRDTVAPSETELARGRSQPLDPRIDHGVISSVNSFNALPSESTPPSTSSIVASRPMIEAQPSQPSDDMQNDLINTPEIIEPPTAPPQPSKDGTVPQKHSKSRKQSSSTISPSTEQAGPSKRVRSDAGTKKRGSKTVEAGDRGEEEGEPSDPTKITMSQLIRDVPIGRPAPGRLEKVQKLEESRRRNREMRGALRDKDRRITMGLPRDPDDENPKIITPPPAPGEANRATGNGSPELAVDEDDDMEFINNLPGHAIVPRMMMGEHGRISVDERSITYARPDVIPDESMRHITERESDRFVNSLSHSKKNKGGQRWSKLETAEFYHVCSNSLCC